MEQFCELFDKIDQTKSTREKVYYMQEYFSKASPEDAAWALFFLSGQKLKRLIGPSKLYDWMLEIVSFPPWIALEAYSVVGDLAETIALLIPRKDRYISSISLSEWVNRILLLRNCSSDQQKESILQFWQELDQRGIFILNKIMTGSLRVGVSHLLTLQALSKTLSVSKETLSQRLMGNWTPTAEFFESLKRDEDQTFGSHLNPYPFYLASPIAEPLEDLGDINDWIVEWKWDGIRAQIVNRDGKVAIWSRGNELITYQFPEVAEVMQKCESGTVLDGEILAYQNGKPLPFSELQKRLGRKKVTPAMISSIPIIYMIYDILEYHGKDIRRTPLTERRALFENWTDLDPKVKISPKVSINSWNNLREKRKEASSYITEGLILKRKTSPYGIGRRRGNWWKYKIDPHTIDLVLIYAQPGQGGRANLYTDYTFGVWHQGKLIPITKAYFGLSKEEITELDRWIRKNTEEKFGPVRQVKSEQVFEIAFEGIQRSSRHKSGLALRFPRISRWRKDKLISECDSLEQIKQQFFEE